MNGRKVLLLTASPRGAASVSRALGEYLLARLEERSMAIKSLPLYPALGDEKRLAELLAAVDLCSLLVVSFPLYVDHLPSPLIELLRQVADRRAGRGAEARQSLAAIVQCGFPESAHCRPAADVVRLFAAQAGFRFLGCLACGMGGAVGGRELKGTGGVARHQLRALGEAAAFLADDREIPAGVVERMGRPMIPRWFYNLAADWGWKRQAKKFATSARLKERPYSEER